MKTRIKGEDYVRSVIASLRSDDKWSDAMKSVTDEEAMSGSFDLPPSPDKVKEIAAALAENGEVVTSIEFEASSKTPPHHWWRCKSCDPVAHATNRDECYIQAVLRPDAKDVLGTNTPLYQGIEVDYCFCRYGGTLDDVLEKIFDGAERRLDWEDGIKYMTHYEDMRWW